MSFEYNNALGTSFNYYAYAYAPQLIQKKENLVIEASVKKDKLHIEVNEKNLGRDITFYRNSISKFFAKFFNLGHDLEINGYHFFVNKKSLDKHLISSNKDFIISANNIVKNYNSYFEKYKQSITLG